MHHFHLGVKEISAGKKGIDFEAFAKHVRKDGFGKGPFMNVWEGEFSNDPKIMGPVVLVWMKRG